MEKHSENIGQWLQIAQAEGVGPVIFSRLFEHFGSVEATEIEDLRLKIENLSSGAEVKPMRERRI